MLVRETAPKTRRPIRGAFTLLEVLIVVAIIVMLAGVGAYFLLPQLEDAKVKIARAEMQGIAKQADIYTLNNNGPPGDVTALAAPQPSGAQPLMPLDKTNDPWGHPYVLSTGAQGQVVVSCTTPAGKVISTADPK